MSGQSTERTWISAQIPVSYRAALFARSEREDRSASSLVRSALAAFLFENDRSTVELDERQK